MTEREIGGYFELGVAPGRLRHSRALPVNFGRAGLLLIVQAYGYRKVWIPDYICPSVENYLKTAGIGVGRYEIGFDLEPVAFPRLGDREAFLYVNYFGVKDSFCRELEVRFSGNLILDLTQAYYYKPTDAAAFNSPRKFFGIPDGCFAYGEGLDRKTLPDSFSSNRCEALLRRLDGDLAGGYASFKAYEDAMGLESPARMSKLSLALLKANDTRAAMLRRRKNLRQLHAALGDANRMVALPRNFASCGTDESALLLSYPFLVEDGAALRQRLIDAKVFCPTYWPGLSSLGAAAQKFVRDLVCLPADQRYGEADMNRIVEVVCGR